MKQTPYEFICAVPSATPNAIAPVDSTSIRIYAEPIAFTTLIRSANLVLSHGSAGIVCEALMNGKLQLIDPVDIEKGLVARCLSRRNLATIFSAAAPSTAVAQVIKNGLHNEILVMETADCGERLRPIDWGAVLCKLVATAVS